MFEQKLAFALVVFLQLALNLTVVFFSIKVLNSRSGLFLMFYSFYLLITFFVFYKSRLTYITHCFN